MAAAVRVVASQQTGFRLVVVHRDGTDGITYNLLGDQIDIGRTEGDLLFEDPHLAPRHARIVASLTGRVLTPLETRNGVYVRLRGPVDLQDGDYVLMGKQVLRFELVSEPERNVRPALEHGVVVFGTPVRPPWARLRQITPAGVGRDIFHLTRPDMVLGREIGDIIFSEDEFMSRRHAQVSVPQRPRAPGGPGQLERHVPAPARPARPGLGRPHPIGRRAAAVRDRIGATIRPMPPTPPDISIEVFGKTDVGLIREHNEDNFLIADVTGGVRTAEPRDPVHASSWARRARRCWCATAWAARRPARSPRRWRSIRSTTRSPRPSRSSATASRACCGGRSSTPTSASSSSRATTRASAAWAPPARWPSLVDETLVVAQIGDSRCYVLRDGKLAQVTKDQSLAWQLIEAGAMTAEEAKAFEHANIILQALGVQERVEVVLSQVHAAPGRRRPALLGRAARTGGRRGAAGRS